MLRIGRALLFIAFTFLLTAFGSPGCSPTKKAVPTGSVRGVVSTAKRPLSEGTIGFFHSATGFAVDFELSSEGSFASNAKKPLPVGDYMVTVSPLTVMIDNDPGKTPPARVEKNDPNIPTKYRRQASSPLRAKVGEGENEINFVLTP